MTQKTNMTPVEWLADKVTDMIHESNHIELVSLLEQAKQMEKEQKEMSNEEIWNASIEYDNGAILETPMVHFQQGAFWYREQLKKRQ